MPPSRRELLAATATTGAAALAGCTGGCGQGLPLLGTSMPHDAEIGVSAVDSVPDEATVVTLSDLPDAERSLLRTAVSDGVVRACMDDGGERADALRSFSNRLGQDTHLADGDDRYALWVRIEDGVVEMTGDPPEGDENPCC